MNRLLIFLSLIFYFQIVSAQQLPLFTQYRSNHGAINPASINGDYFIYENNLSFGASYRNQWTGIDAAPNTQHLYGEFLFTERGSFNFLTGGYLINDRTGPTGFTGLYGRFAGVLAGNDPQYAGLSFGLNLGLVQYKVDGTQIRLREQNDVLGNQSYSQWFPDAGLGVFGYTTLETGILEDDLIYGGISIPQVIGLDLSFGTENGEFSTQRIQHIYAHGGLYHFISDESFLEFSTWFRYAPNAPVNADFNVRYQLAGNFWGGLGFSTASNVHLEAGFILGGNLGFSNTVKFGYGFDYSVSNFGPTVGSTHELNIGVSLNR